MPAHIRFSLKFHLRENAVVVDTLVRTLAVSDVVEADIDQVERLFDQFSFS